MANSGQSFLLGSGTLNVWGEVDPAKVDEDALNDWWTNEHLAERLSAPGFLRARRYFCRNDDSPKTKYLTLYEVSSVDTLTSQPYMDQLNNPTPGTLQHRSTLATMNRSACRVMYSDVRQDLKPCKSGIGATAAVFVLSLPQSDEIGATLRDLLSKAFATMQQTNKTVMNFTVLQEDKAATTPGRSTQSYGNPNTNQTSRNSETVKWTVLFEFSSSARQPLGGIQKILKPIVDELSIMQGKEGQMTFDVYEYLCCAIA